MDQITQDPQSGGGIPPVTAPPPSPTAAPDPNSRGGPAPAAVPPPSPVVSHDPSRRTGPPGRLDVSVDDETYEAGSGNIIVVTLRNPFDVPIEIIELKEPRSTSLRSSHKQLVTSGNEARPKKSFWEYLPGIGLLFGSGISASFGFGGVKAQFSSTADKELVISADDNSIVDLGAALSGFDKVVVNASPGSKVTVASPTHPEEPAVRVVRPRCETNAFLTIGTRGWLFFKPTRLRLKSEVRYRIDGDPNEFTQVMPLNFDVRPPLRSVIIGAIVGALAGGAARFINDVSSTDTDLLGMTLQKWVIHGIKLGGAVVMAIIATVALSRKTGAQGFITVEDFFGGFVVGVLVAYRGTSYFEDLLNYASSTGAARQSR